MKNKSTFFGIFLALCIISLGLACFSLRSAILRFDLGAQLERISWTPTTHACCVASIVIPALTIVIFSIIRSVQAHSEAFVLGFIVAAAVIVLCGFSFLLYIGGSLIFGSLLILSPPLSDSGDPPIGIDPPCALTGSSGCN